MALFINNKNTYNKYFKKIIVYLLTISFVTITLFFSSEFTTYADNEVQNSNVPWPTSPDIYAEAGVLVEASTGTVLYDKNCHNKMYPASITKILTTLLALENGNLSDMVEYSHYDVYSLEPGDAHISRQEGELLSLKDSLYGVMLASANEAANAVGEYVSKKSDAYTNKINELKASGTSFDESQVAISVFADMMNERAKQAGALDSNFVNPNGLFNENHYTTCYDMAMITRDAIKQDEFLKIESDLTYVIPTTNKNAETLGIANRHKMLFPLNSVYYDGILGGKTGYVDQSGSTLVTFAKRNGMTLISVVMKSNGANVYNDTKLLLDYGFNNFSLANISQNENKFTFDNSGFFGACGTVFSTSSPIISINDEGNVVLPNGVNFTDCRSELNFINQDKQTDSAIANLDYYYLDNHIGGATLTINSNNDESFNFSPEKETNESSTNKSSKNFITINIWLILAIIIIIAVIILIIFYLNNINYIKRKIRRKRNMRNRGGYKNLKSIKRRKR